jgi:hypothetical protein
MALEDGGEGVKRKIVAYLAADLSLEFEKQGMTVFDQKVANCVFSRHAPKQYPSTVRFVSDVP